MAESLLNLASCEVDPLKRKKLRQEQLAIDEDNGDVEGMATAYQYKGHDSFHDGDYEKAWSAYKESLKYYQLVNNPDAIAFSWFNLGIGSLFNGDLVQASQYIEQSLSCNLDLGNENRTLDCLLFKARLEVAKGAYDQAREISDRIMHITQKTDRHSHLADTLCLRIRIARLQGELNTAREYVQEIMQIEQNDPQTLLLALQEIGYLALQSGDLQEARVHFRKAVQITTNRRYGLYLTGGIWIGLTFLAVRERKMEHSALLFGTRWSRGYTFSLSPIERIWCDAGLAEVKAALGENRLRSLYDEGRSQSFEQTAKLAMEV